MGIESDVLATRLQTLLGTINTTSAAAVPTPPGTKYNLVTAATTNAAVIKATAGNMYHILISNPTATAAFVKLYDKATAPTVGTDVPVVTIPIGAAGTANAFVAVPLSYPGQRFTAGIGIAVTAAAVATDTAVTVAGIQIAATYV
jgi:hypothetical protein